MTEQRKEQQNLPAAPAPRSLSYPASRLAPAFELVDLAHEIEQADQLVSARTNAKLQVIADQIRNLQAKARTIMEQAASEQRLHRARCHFSKRPGQIYHLYQSGDQDCYFSLLSPADWQGKPPHRHLGSYRLENDLSWTPVPENTTD